MTCSPYVHSSYFVCTIYRHVTHNGQNQITIKKI